MEHGSKPVALVTGTSSGIGAAAAVHLLEAGFRVFGSSRQYTRTRLGNEYETLQLDVTDDSSVRRAVEHVMQREGRIDVLVNNAGKGIAGGAEESSVEQAIDLFNANLFGVMRLTRAVLPIMRRQQHGRIINVSSILGLIPAPYQALYSSTKHAIEGYSESLDHEVRNFGVRVVLVEPAYTRTKFGENIAFPDQPVAIYDAARASLLGMLPELMRKADDPDVVGKVIAKAAVATSPKLRYTAGKLAGKLSVLRRLVPAFMFDASLRKELNLD